MSEGGSQRHLPYYRDCEQTSRIMEKVKKLGRLVHNIALVGISLILARSFLLVGFGLSVDNL